MAKDNRRPSGRPRDLLVPHDLADKAQFILLSTLLLFDRRISEKAKIVYGIIRAHAIGKDYGWPGQARLAVMASCSIRTIQRTITELVEVNLLRIERRGRPAQNVYFLNPLHLAYTADEIEWCSQVRTTQEWIDRFPPEDPETVSAAASEPDESQVQSNWEDEHGDASEALRNPSNFQMRHPCQGRHDISVASDTTRMAVEVDESFLRKEEDESETRGAGYTLLPEKNGADRRQDRPDRVSEEGRRKSFGRKTRGEDPVSGGLPQRAPARSERTYAKTQSGVHERLADSGEVSVTKDSGSPPRTRQRAPEALPRADQIPFEVAMPGDRPEIKQPVQEKALNVPQLYADWRQIVVERHPDAANSIPNRMKMGKERGKLWNLGRSLLLNYDGVMPDGRAGYSVLLDMIRMAVWDWEAVQANPAAKWAADGHRFPTMREVYLLADFLNGYLKTGVVSPPMHRVSKFYEKFLAKTQPQSQDQSEDEIDRTAKREGKTRAAILREIRAGREIEA